MQGSLLKDRIRVIVEDLNERCCNLLHEVEHYEKLAQMKHEQWVKENLELAFARQLQQYADEISITDPPGPMELRAS